MAGKETASAAVRRCIERGLERYRQGDLGEAIAEWEQALQLDAENVEAQNLIKVARGMMPSGPPKPGGGSGPNPWSVEEKTDAESPQETRQRVLRAESEAALVHATERQRRGKMTIESPVSAFLAPITSPAWKPPTGTQPAVTDTIRDSPAVAGSLRATEMLDRCRTEFGNRQFEAAAAAAEGALLEADRTPLPEVIDAAATLFEKVFVALLGSGKKIPVFLMTSDADPVKSLGAPRATVLTVLTTIDGVTNVDQILRVNLRPPVDRLQRLRVLAALLRNGAIKLV